jgi:hypothetical protein
MTIAPLLLQSQEGYNPLRERGEQMTITLNLPDAVEGALKREATSRGTTPEELILSDLERLYLVPETDLEPPLKTGADLLKLWKKEGAFLAREDLPDSPELARQIREQVQHERDYLWDTAE